MTRTIVSWTIRTLTVAVLLGAIVGAAVILSGKALANPGQCFTSPWGGFCDGDMLPNGTYCHCEGAMGFTNCFYVRPAPTSVDPRGWVPA